MVFALPPHTLISMLDLSWPKILLGSKKADPTAWRILNDLFTGKTKRPQQKTLDRIGAQISEKFSAGRPFDVFDMARETPDGRPWETLTAMWNAGVMASGGEPMATFSTEAVRLERIADAARAAAKVGDLRKAFDHIQGWDLNTLSCQQWIMAHIDCSGSLEQFQRTAAPLVIVATLYLLACWAVDFSGPDVPQRSFSIMPEQRGDRMIRPMRRWLEGVKSDRNIRTLDDMADFLLRPSPKEDVETLRRQFRKWWQRGEVPAWSMVPRIVASLSQVLRAEHPAEIEKKINIAMAAIRFVDNLLTHSLAIRDKILPKYDPLAPFRDYPQMRRHAAEVEAALSAK